MKSVVIKFSIVFALLFAIMVKNANSQNEIIISGILQNTKPKSIVLLTKNTMPDVHTDTTYLDKTGKFKLKIQTTKSNYYILRQGENELDLFLTPGDSITLTADINKLLQTVKFTGNNSAVNQYLVSKQLLSNKIYSGVRALFALPKDSFVTKCDSLKDVCTNNFEQFLSSEKNVSKEFITIERASLLYEWMLYRFNYFGSCMRTQKITNFDVNSDYFDFVSEIDLNNHQLLNLWNYKGCLWYYINHRLRKKFGDEYDNKNSKIQWTLEKYKLIPQISNNEAIKNFMYYYEMNSEILYSKNQDILDKIYQQFQEKCTNQHYKSLIKELYDVRNSTASGKSAPDFTCVDTTGNAVSLSDFKGKYVYIDIWATWCRPCIKEIPHFEKLKDEFKNKNIVFMSISLDKTTDIWQKALKDKNMKGIQLFAKGEFNSEIAKKYSVTGIPRFILIDKDGNIINSKAERPSKNIHETLKKLEDI